MTVAPASEGPWVIDTPRLLRRTALRLPALAANETDGDALDRKGRRAGIDDDRLERCILGHQDDVASALAKTLDRHFIAGDSTNSCHDDLAIACLACAMHGEKIAVEDAGVAHAFAADAQQVIRARREQQRIEAVTAFDVLRSENGAAGRNAADQGQRALHRRTRQVLQSQPA